MKAWTKWLPFSQTIFLNVFSWRHFFYLDTNLPKIIPEAPVDNKEALVQLMAWHQTAGKPFIIWTDNDPLHYDITGPQGVNNIEAETNGRHLADNIFKCIFLNENVWIPIKISLKFVPKGLINNIPALVQIMAWRRLGDKPLSEAMMVRSATHICVTRPQWVKRLTRHSIGKCQQNWATDVKIMLPNVKIMLCYPMVLTSWP